MLKTIIILIAIFIFGIVLWKMYKLFVGLFTEFDVLTMQEKKRVEREIKNKMN